MAAAGGDFAGRCKAVGFGRLRTLDARMKIGRRSLSIIGAGLLLAAGSLALVEAQPDAPSEVAPPSSAVPDESPPDAIEVPQDGGAMNPIPDSVSSSSRQTGDGRPLPGQAVRLELPPLRIIEPGQPLPPPPRTRAGFAIIQALDKVTAQTIRFSAPVGQPVRYENLIFTVRACEATNDATSAPEAAAYVEVLSQARPRVGYPTPPARQVFRGWMFASTPSLHPLEHPVYDAWVIACSATAPAPAAPAAANS